MILGLTGYARTGKDTVAEILIKDYGFERIAFADPIRNLLFELNPLVNGVRLQDMVNEYGWEITKSQIEVRRLLQNLGVGARNVFGENFWINQALLKVNLSKDYVVTDVRFKNEIAAIRKLPSRIWRIQRSGVVAVNNHISEHDLDDVEVDYTLLNEGPIEYLSTLVEEQMQVLRVKKQS